MNCIALQAEHWPSVKRIYETGLASGTASFETQAPSWESWNESHLDYARFVALIDDQVVGWIALSPKSDRCVYGGVAEVSVYIDPNHQRKGIGKILIQKAIESSEANGIWTLNAAMFPENEGSIALHQKMGFRQIGYREKIGKRKGVWYDNVLMERRSPNVW